jgi:hypothetical protein
VPIGIRHDVGQVDLHRRSHCAAHRAASAIV